MTASILVLAAAVLGALSFFEPCTIATHALFSVRVHSSAWPGGCRELLLLWVTRSLLTVGLLLLALTLTEPPAWGAYVPSAILAIMATVYIVSRFQYIPVPHLEFHKLVPGGARLPHAARLGLTLPACTLPLFVIVLGMAITLDSHGIAVAGGLLFAGLFTLPTAVASVTGLTGAGQRFLRVSALATPYVTAGLLYGSAVYLLP
jgi:cytochrome c-type biogenesis protein